MTGNTEAPMTRRQEQHLVAVIHSVSRRIDRKYRAGAVEHSGDIRDLTPVQLVEEALNEVADLFVYLETVKVKLMAMTSVTDDSGDPEH